MGNSFKKKGKKAGKSLRKLERKPFKTTNLPEIDDFFSKIQEPMDTVCDLSDAFSAINEAIIGLTEAQEFLEAHLEKKRQICYQIHACGS